MISPSIRSIHLAWITPILIVTVCLLGACGRGAETAQAVRIVVETPCEIPTAGFQPLAVSGSIPEGAQIRWEASAGTFSEDTGITTTYLAPETSAEMTVTITAIVSVGDQELITDPLNCKIIPGAPPESREPPTAPPVESKPTPLPTLTVPAEPSQPASASQTTPPLTCRHPELTAFVFPQLKDVPTQRAFYGPLDQSEAIFKCQGVYDRVRSAPVAVRIEYHVQDTKFGYFGVGTLEGYNISQFKRLCVWAYAEQPYQAFRLKMRDANNVENGVNLTIPETNQWSQLCADLSQFTDLGIDLTQIDNINVGFEAANGDATVWLDDFELVGSQ